MRCGGVGVREHTFDEATCEVKREGVTLQAQDDLRNQPKIVPDTAQLEGAVQGDTDTRPWTTELSTSLNSDSDSDCDNDSNSDSNSSSNGKSDSGTCMRYSTTPHHPIT